VKWVFRVAVVAVLLAVGIGVAALLALPSLVESDEVRSRIEQAALEATGRTLSYESLEFGVLPPSLRVMRARVSGETGGDEDLLAADEVSLRVALLPLLIGAVVIDALVVEGAQLRLERGPDGLVLPSAPPKPSRADASAGPEPAAGDEGSDSGLSLGVRSVEVRSSQLTLLDRTVQPAVRWDLSELEARARGESLAAPIDLELSAGLGGGGTLRVTGTSTTGGELDLVLALDAVEVAPLAPYLADVSELAGALSGELRLGGPAAALTQAGADLRGRGMRFRQGDTAVAGDLSLRADVEQPLAAPAGPFELDATAATLALGSGLQKPADVPARLSGRIAPGAGGAIAVEQLRLVLRNLEAQGRVASLSPFVTELSAPAFDVAGWEALLPALADLRPSGPIRFDGLRFASQPPDLRGGAQLDGLSVEAQEGAPVSLRGGLVFEGNALRSEQASVEAAGQVSDLELRVDELFGKPRYRVRLKAREADSNELLTGLLAKPDTLYGPLGLDLDLSGALAGDPLQSLSGTIDFGVEQGRLVGVSLLRAVFDRLGSAGSLAVNLGKGFGGRDLQRFYGDEFELLRGALRIRSGVARTDDLTLRYRGYAVRLAGTLGLVDLAIDMAGELTLNEELDAAIASELSVKDYTPRQRVVPLARVDGRLDDPRVRLDSGVATRFAAAYAGDAYAGKLREKAERELGPGAGDLVDQGLGVLEGILGGGRSRPQAPSQPDPEPPADR
jgi:uncharacterized protein involved in outer membrane biogenesis